MNICVSLRDPAPQNLRQGNLRSEGRWERQALEACVLNDKVDAIYTAGYEWQDGRGISSKYGGEISRESAKNCILLMHDWNSSVINKVPYYGAIVNVFSGPWLEQKDAIDRVFRKMQGRLLFTLGYPALHDSPTAVSYLENFLPRDHVCLLPVPGIPDIVPGNNFDKTRLLWMWRLIFMSQMANAPELHWAMEKLQEDPSLRLTVLTGWFKEEVKNYVDNQVVYVQEDINDAFWKLEEFRQFEHLRPQVDVLYHIGWEDVLNLYKETKLLITHSKHFGGPSLEAAMHGIPFVGNMKNGCLCNFDGYLYESTPEKACSILNGLLYDRNYYTLVGNSYRDFVWKEYTYEAFNNNLNQLVKRFGFF